MKNIAFVFAVSAFVFASCAKEGLGGDATLVVKPQHHGVNIPSLGAYPDSVFIKFEAKEVPADPIHDYDALFVGAAGEEHIHCEGLKWGYYSVYCTGWDTTINERVVGGLTIKINRSERKEEITVEVPVVED